MKKTITLLTFLFSLVQFLQAQPTLVKDINEGAPDSYYGGWSNETMISVVLNDILYFTAKDGINGFELWKSDGTADGTEMVKDIFPGADDSTPSDFVRLGNQILFFANNGQNGVELWKSDGTTVGTSLVKDINPGAADAITSNFYEMEVMGDYAYFQAFEGTNGAELWRTDGTEAGTTLVSDILPGSSSSSPSNLTVMNDVLYFSASGGSSQGIELYRSDGTAAGTYLLKDISNGTFGSSPNSFTVVNNTLFFVATDNMVGYELWKTDGTEVGTVLVKDLESGSASSFENSGNLMFAYNGNLIFVANTTTNEEDLWISDGTETGTVVLYAFDDGFQAKPPVSLTLFNNMVYFYGFDDAEGDGLWRTDGTNIGTMLVSEFSGEFTSLKREMISIEDRLVFVAKESFSTGFELWESDGSSAGTNITGEINPGSSSSETSKLVNINGVAFFMAVDGTHGKEIWKYDPEALPITSFIQQTAEILCNGDAGATLLVNVNQGIPPYSYTWSEAGVVGENPTNLTAGSYSVTVTDADGATTMSSIVVNEPSAITLTLDATPELGGGANGTASVDPDGGSPFYTYLWNTTPAQTSSIAVDLASGDYTVTVTDSNGCTMEGSVFVDMTEDVEDYAALNQLRVYPTITTGLLFWEADQISTINYSIINTSGQMILKGTSNWGEAIDLSDLATGTYFIQIVDQRFLVSRKVILEN